MKPSSSPPPLRLILASASPRRRELLRALEIECEVIPSNIDEAAIKAETPRALAIRTAAAKAQAVAEVLAGREEERLILAADTIVILEDRVLGKPADRAEAARMLGDLSGRTHTVITGLALKSPSDGGLWLHAGATQVTFHEMAPEWIARYVASGESDDKAGAYGIQGQGRDLIARLDGELSNVIGLPLERLREGAMQMAQADAMGRATEREILAKAYPDLERAEFFRRYR